MLHTSLVLTSLFAASAFAAPKLAQRATTHTIKVGGNNELVFTPYAISAEKGDIVDFVFTTKNHSVVQSSFASPCGPLANGFNTGFQFVAPGTTEDKLPKVSYTVTTEKDRALWFYCSQAINTPNAHCAKGMVFSINCPLEGTNSFDNFLSKAKSDPAATNPAPPPSRPTDVIVPLAPEPTYPGITYPPATPPETKTDAITLGTSTWTTTYASYPGSPDPTPAAEDGVEIKVLVGADGLTFSPSNVPAKPRDRILFEFQAKNHSVVQSSFAAPCKRFTTADGVLGIHSGFQPVAAGQPKPTFTVRVNDTTPLYFYCSQPGHCGQGMVFSVNLNDQSPRSFSAFQSLAKQLNGSTNGTPNGPDNGNTPPPQGAAATLGANLGSISLAGVVALAVAVAL